MSREPFEAVTLRLLRRAFEVHPPPRVKALHLPPGAPDDAGAGESCAIELDDGSMGLSYVLFGRALARMRDPSRTAPLDGADALALAQGLERPAAEDDGAPRTLGLAAANALTASLWRRAGWEPPAAPDSLAGLAPSAGDAVGMVGFFPPLAPRVLATGARLVVVELRSELAGLHDGVRVTTDTQVLAGCTQVICTGTVLLNGTLDAMLDLAPRARRFALVGPSAGLLPDALFERGVTALGGSWVVDGVAMAAALRCGEPRGPAARKFLLTREAYPGLSALSRAADSGGARPDREA